MKKVLALLYIALVISAIFLSVIYLLRNILPEDKTYNFWPGEQKTSDSISITENITLFFPDYGKTGFIDNPPVGSVKRKINKTLTLEERCLLAMEKLFEGPTKDPSEENLGNVFCDYCTGSKTIWGMDLKEHELNPLNIKDVPQAKSCIIENGLAKVDFNFTYLFLQGTSAYDIKAKTKAIEETIKAITGVNNVLLSVEGFDYPCTNSSPNCREIIYELAKRNILVETAKYGEGITHLARKVLRTHIIQQRFLENEIILTADQTLFAEDYIQNKTGTYSLKLGQQVKFPLGLIEEAIEKAKGR